MRRGISLANMILYAAVLLAGHAFAGEITQDLQHEISRLGPTDDVAVIVRFRDPVDLRKIYDNTPGLRREKIVRALLNKSDAEHQEIRTLLATEGAVHERQLWLINGRSAELSVAAVKRIARHPRVKSVDLDRKITLSSIPASCSASPAGWNLDAVHVAELWALGHRGAGVVVATLDSGADPDHPDLGPNWRGGINSWFDPYGEYDSPTDGSGHGTGALGLLVGGDTSGTAIGMAPDAQWVSARIFDDSGTATLSAIHASFQWLLDPDGNPATDDAPDIVNNSWVLDGTINQCDTEFQSDIDTLGLADIAVVISAGNSGPLSASSMSPANGPQSLAVGAVGEALGSYFVADSSARGPSACDGSIYPQLVAPGANMVTADRTLGGLFPDSYTCVSGTSFAAPHFSGALAVLKSAMDSMGLAVTTSQLETALLQGASEIGDVGPDNDSGAGLLDVYGAYNWLLANVDTPQPGELHFDVTDHSVAEDAGDVMVSVSRSNGSSGTVTVDYSASELTATSGADYSIAEGTLTFLDGQTSQNIVINILDDTDVEDNEQLTLTLSNPTEGVALGNLSVTTITIADNDSPQPPPDVDSKKPVAIAAGGGSVGLGQLLLLTLVVLFGWRQQRTAEARSGVNL